MAVGGGSGPYAAAVADASMCAVAFGPRAGVPELNS